MRHVRTPEGSAHFKLPIGSPLTGHHLDALPNGAKVAFGGHLFQRVEGDDGAGRWNNTTGDPRDSVHHDVMRFFARHGQVHNPADPEAPKPVGAPAAKASGPTSESRDYRADPRYQPVPVRNDPKVVARLKAEQAAGNSPYKVPERPASPDSVPVRNDPKVVARLKAERAAGNSPYKVPERPAPPAAKASGPTSESRDYRADPRYQPVPVKQDPKVVARLKAEQAARGKVPAGASPDPKKWGTATPAEQAKNRAIREAWNNRPEAQAPSKAKETPAVAKAKNYFSGPEDLPNRQGLDNTNAPAAPKTDKAKERDVRGAAAGRAWLEGGNGKAAGDKAVEGRRRAIIADAMKPLQSGAPTKKGSSMNAEQYNRSVMDNAGKGDFKNLKIGAEVKESDFEQAEVGHAVEDSDGKIWVKQADGTWRNDSGTKVDVNLLKADAEDGTLRRAKPRVAA